MIGAAGRIDLRRGSATALGVGLLALLVALLPAWLAPARQVQEALS